MSMYPAIVSGVITPLAPGIDIYMDGSSHILTNPMGTIRLKGSEPVIFDSLNDVDDGKTAVLLVGRYYSVEGLQILVDKVSVLAEPMERIAGLDGHAAELKFEQTTSERSRDPGDVWPNPLTVVAPPPEDEEHVASAGLMFKDGKYELQVNGWERISSVCDYPDVSPGLDPGFNPSTYPVVVRLKQKSDQCIQVIDQRWERWSLETTFMVTPRIDSVRIVHATGKNETVSVKRL